MSIDKETVQHVAYLARMELESGELEKLSSQLQEILVFIDKLSLLDVKEAEPASHILPLSNVLREDSPKECLTPEEALRNAPAKDGNFFTVPKIIE
ncbi:MAG: Asp-tRNA(Asn)/Glu-tRNA(Gln) amidotransferase subunit GatC [Candidatus Omnitrophica bacterium]|nr:Asp-tRNA(Asn)/Glu-tRNA(Gln) amidotransferase subunit GatC [Candidatus Omnitrophota bacterium]